MCIGPKFLVEEKKTEQKAVVCHAGVLHTPASFSDLVLTYKTGIDLPELLERHIVELAEAEVILKLQVRFP